MHVTTDIRHTVQRTYRFLLVPAPPLWRFCLLAFPLATLPSLVLAATAYWLASLAGLYAVALRSPEPFNGLGILGPVLIGPVVETLILAGILRALVEFTERDRRTLVSVISALMFGLLHGYFAPLWFFGTVWSFFVFSRAYLTWREVSFGHAFLAAALPHALNNLLVVSVISVQSA